MLRICKFEPIDHTDIIKALMDQDERLKHIGVEKLKTALIHMVRELCSELILLKHERIKMNVYNVQFELDDWGDEQASFRCFDSFFTVPSDQVHEERTGLDNAVIHHIFVDHQTYMCPMCGEEIKTISINGRIVSGGHSSQNYLGVCQDMCFKCSRKLQDNP